MALGRASILRRPKRLLLDLFRKHYYRYLYPHFDNIENSGVGRIVRNWERHHWMGDNPRDSRDWDRQYSQGKWDLLLAPGQLEKTSVILGYVRAHSESPSILDIGCGNGVVVRPLNDSDCSSYTGVDISEQAIEELRKEPHDNHHYVVGPAEDMRNSTKASTSPS